MEGIPSGAVKEAGLGVGIVVICGVLQPRKTTR
jgi:hypothetical protein